MMKRVSKVERWELITGGRTRPLDPSEATEVALLADLLADPSTWAEPRAGLEEDVVQAVVDAVRPSTSPPRRSRPAADGITASPWSAGRPQRRSC